MHYQRATLARAAIVVGYVLAALIFTWPLASHLSTHLTGDPGGDTGVYVWNQWVFHQELTEGHNPLRTEKILALSSPIVDLTQHNYTPFLNLLALPLISPLGLTAAFNIVFLIVCVLNGVALYGLARRATGANRIEAFLAGLLFAWSPAMNSRTVGHFSLYAAAALPAFVWCLLNAERSRSLRDSALVGLCMAWAALSDAYFGIYCLMIALLYVAASAIRVTRAHRATPQMWRWLVDLLIVCLAALIVGLGFGHGGQFTVLGIAIRMQTLYTPVLVLTILVIVRALLTWRPQFDWPFGTIPVSAVLIAFIACVGPLSPVLYGLSTRVAQGSFVSPEIYWRSSPPGVDLLSFVTPNPLHPLARFFTEDPLLTKPTVYVEYTAALSLVAFAIIGLAIWRARYRPSAGWCVIAVGFALLAMGPFIHVGGIDTHVPGPWAVLRYAPGISLARMPTRFVLVASMGFAVIFAGALAALGAAWPHRRRQIVAIAAVLLVFELWPAPRTLYSAGMSPIYDRIAQDTRDVRVLVLPFGVRDGTWETGNFRPRTQYNQTRHGKPLIGGYLSRISTHRVERMRQEHPTLDALIKVSEKAPLDPGVAAILRERGADLVDEAHLGYVVIDDRFIAPDRAQLVVDALRLREVQKDAPLTLYAPR